MRSVIALALIVIAVSLTASSSRYASACGGSPPPFFCAKTYVFAKAVPDGNVVANQATAVKVNTFHFLNLIEFPPGNCSALPASVSMSATLDCDVNPDGGPFNFGPFPLTEGPSVTSINVPIAAGPPRRCVLSVTATASFSDGSQIAQTADQTICIVAPAPQDPNIPIVAVEVLGDDISCAHPGDGHAFTFRITNNDLVNDFSGTYSAWINNVADLPEVNAGPNGTDNGVFALADPGGADAFPLAVDDGSGDCVKLPPDPHNQFPTPLAGSITVPAGGSTDLTIKSRTWPLCTSGSCGEAVLDVNGFHTSPLGSRGPEQVRACAGFVVVADNSATPQFACPGSSGRAVTQTFGSGGAVGPSAVLRAAPDPKDANNTTDVEFELDIAAMQLLINGVPITGGTPSFSGVTQVDGGHIRNVAEFSFIEPQPQSNDVITMINEFLVNPNNPGTQEFIDLMHVAGAPNGLADIAPFAHGRMIIDEKQRTGLDPFELEFLHQISAVGVEAGTFNQVPMQNMSVQFQKLSMNRYRVTSEWMALQRGVSMIGFDVQNDYRGFARLAPPPCPADLTADGVVDVFDLFVLLNNWGADGAGADLATPNDTVDVFDLFVLLGAWGPCA